MPQWWEEFDVMLSPYDPATGYLLFDDVTNDYVIRAGLEMEGKTVRLP